MPTDPTGTVRLSTGRRWSIVIVSLVVTASSFVFINGVAFLIPALEDDLGTPLAEAGLLSSMPSFGMVATLILWGYLLDRVGERIVLTVGSALTAVAAYFGDDGPLDGVVRCAAVRRRHGGRQLQLGRRSPGLRVVPARAARPGDGCSPDCAAARNCVGRVGYSRAVAAQPVGDVRG